MTEFSVFTLGTGAPTTTTSNIEIDDITATTGDSIDISAEVENRGQSDEERTLELGQRRGRWE